MDLSKLSIELVPSTCWYSNVRSQVTRKKWNEIRFYCYAKASFKCEICGKTGPRHHPLDCHEIWQYDDNNLTQTLVGFISLCPLCHGVKHYGRSLSQGSAKKVQRHLSKINNWSDTKTLAYIDEIFKLWKVRSRYQWNLDLSLLLNYGIDEPKNHSVSV